MFDFLRRFLGTRPPNPDDIPPGLVATITVRGYGQREALYGRATLEAFDGSGARRLSATVTIQPSQALVAQLAPSRRAGDVATGDYVVDAVLPAREDAEGIALFGPYPVLRLRAVAGERQPPPVFGLTVLLIHGGPAGQPTDGSIRMIDSQLDELLHLLPPEPDTVRVQLIQDGTFDTEQPDWVPAEADQNRHDWRYYDQLYRWDRLDTGSAPYADLSSGTGSNEGDAAAALALSDLGYGVQSDAGAPPPDSPADRAGSDPAAASTDGDTGWAPDGGAYTR